MRTLLEFILGLFGGNRQKGMVRQIIEKLLFDKLAGGTGQTSGATGAGGPLEILFEKFKNKGLGDVFGSWVGPGANAPVSPEQVTEAVGEDHMREIAAQSNMSLPDLAAQLSKYLPGVVDKMTPGGKLPGQ